MGRFYRECLPQVPVPGLSFEAIVVDWFQCFLLFIQQIFIENCLVPSVIEGIKQKDPAVMEIRLWQGGDKQGGDAGC